MHRFKQADKHLRAHTHQQARTHRHVRHAHARLHIPSSAGGAIGSEGAWALEASIRLSVCKLWTFAPKQWVCLHVAGMWLFLTSLHWCRLHPFRRISPLELCMLVQHCWSTGSKASACITACRGFWNLHLRSDQVMIIMMNSAHPLCCPLHSSTQPALPAAQHLPCKR